MKILAILCLITASLSFQAGDNTILGTYRFGTARKIEFKKDHTFLETKGGDWRNGMWKLSHDTLVLQEGMLHSANPRAPLAQYVPFFLFKKGVVYAGQDAFFKETPKK
ncbi:MAG: hypothetical protein ACHQRM_04980 [Bacteroidia bacterium]